MFQAKSTRYNTITEACAEIISSEYFEDSYADCYGDIVLDIKKLMEIIGPNPVWDYCFTGDFSEIENKVKSNLSSDEYDAFIKCLSYSDRGDRVYKSHILFGILDDLYENIYGESIENNEVINVLSDGAQERRVVRYYFNKDYINSNYSYYEDYNNPVVVPTTFNNMINDKAIIPIVNHVHSIDYNETINTLKKENNDIDLNNHYGNIWMNFKYVDNFKEYDVIFEETGKILITGDLGDERIYYKSVDELKHEGILLEDKYYSSKGEDTDTLTPSEYLNGNYDKENTFIDFVASGNCTINYDYSGRNEYKGVFQWADEKELKKLCRQYNFTETYGNKVPLPTIDESILEEVNHKTK